MMEVPITECCNSSSTNIDISTPRDMIEIFKNNDISMFSDHMYGYAGLMHLEVIKTMTVLSTNIKKSLTTDGRKVVFSGCGTSGRMGFLASYLFNNVLVQLGYKKAFFDYCISGGTSALVFSSEMKEDQPKEGKKDLQSIFKDGIFIGITCGLSAPYVGGQILHCMASKQHNNVLPVVIGFNPIHMARITPVECTTLKSVFKEMVGDGGLIINPVVGPEIITGSTRMKGGTATFIILNSVILYALSEQIYGQHLGVRYFLKLQRQCILCTYGKMTETWPHLLNRCACSVQRGGRVIYVGLDELGLVGLFDAAECSPTFGAKETDFQAYISGAVDAYQYISIDGPLNITLDDFMHCNEGKLSEHDSIIIIQSDYDIRCLQHFLDMIRDSHAYVCVLTVKVLYDVSRGIPSVDDVEVLLSITNDLQSLCTKKDTIQSRKYGQPLSSCLSKILTCLCTKIILNGVSTGCFVLCGKVFNNVMIDIRLSNSKLFARGIRIIQHVCHCDVETAKTSLLKALYCTDHVSQSILSTSLQEYVERGRDAEKVIPTAVLITSLNCTVEKAAVILKSYLSVRSCINATSNAV